MDGESFPKDWLDAAAALDSESLTRLDDDGGGVVLHKVYTTATVDVLLQQSIHQQLL